MSSAIRAKLVLREGPQLARLLGLRAAIDAVEAALHWLPPPLLLTTVTALIFQRTAVSIVADVVPEAGVAGERHHRAVGRAAFGAEARRKRPAEMAGAAHVALRRACADRTCRPSTCRHGRCRPPRWRRPARACVSRAQMRAGWIGTASEFSSGLVLARTIPCRCPAPRAIQALRLPALARSASCQHRGERHLGVAVDARPAADSCGRAPPGRCRSGSPACRSSAPPRNAWSCRRSRCR